MSYPALLGILLLTLLRWIQNETKLVGVLKVFSKVRALS